MALEPKHCQYPRWLIIAIVGSLVSWLTYTYILSSKASEASETIRVTVSSLDRLTTERYELILKRLERIETKLDEMRDR